MKTCLLFLSLFSFSASGASLRVEKLIQPGERNPSWSSIFSYSAPLDGGPLTVSEGDEVTIRFDLPQGYRFRWATNLLSPGSSSKFEVRATLFDSGANIVLRSGYTISDRSVTFVNLSGDFMQPTIIAGPVSRPFSVREKALTSRFYTNRQLLEPEDSRELIFDGVATFEALEFSYTIESYQPGPQTYEGIDLLLSISQGSVEIIPESEVVVFLFIPSLLVLRRRKAAV